MSKYRIIQYLHIDRNMSKRGRKKIVSELDSLVHQSGNEAHETEIHLQLEKDHRSQNQLVHQQNALDR